MTNSYRAVVSQLCSSHSLYDKDCGGGGRRWDVLIITRVSNVALHTQ